MSNTKCILSIKIEDIFIAEVMICPSGINTTSDGTRLTLIVMYLRGNCLFIECFLCVCIGNFF